MQKKWLSAAVCALALVLTACSGGGQGETPQAPEKTPQAPEKTPQVWETNVLRSDEIWDGSIWYYGDKAEDPVFGSDYLRGQIESVTFLDTLNDAPEDAWDVSEAGSGAVMAWVKPTGGWGYYGDYYDLYIGADGGVWAGKRCASLFAGYRNVRKIIFGNAFHTDGAEDMSRMFESCESLQILNLSGFDTSNVQNMSNMFDSCGNLQGLNLISFDTSKVQNMACMFSECESLEYLDLGGIDTANVQNMLYMFDGCHNLTSLDLSNFDTSNVQNMFSMFGSCWSLQSLDLSSFDTSNVQNMSGMFSNCHALRSLNLSSFDTANVQEMSWMFAYDGYLTDLKLSNRFVTSNADTTDMFFDCPAGDDYQHLVN